MTDEKGDGNIPVLFARGRSLAEAWENSMIELYNNGSRARTEYDKKDTQGNYIDPPSIDATMIITTEDPASEPFIHRAFPGGPADLEEYRQEVVEGIKDHWVRDLTNPGDSRWEYTYHERMFAYSIPFSKIAETIASMSDKAKRKLTEMRVRVLLDQPWIKVETRKVRKYDLNEQGEPLVVGEDLEKVIVVNQIGAVIDGLTKTPHTRRVQAVTWKPWEDLVAYDPACLQSMWFRILPASDGTNRLNMNLRIRSNDAYKANFMNMYAFAHMQEYVADRVSERRGEIIVPGRYVHIADSYHIYGFDLENFEKLFLSQLKNRSFEDRTWTRADIAEIIEEAKPMIAEKIRRQDEKYR